MPARWFLDAMGSWVCCLMSLLACRHSLADDSGNRGDEW